MVGNRIKWLRTQKGYSINELSEKAGVSKSYLSHIERGIQMNPSLQVLSKLAHTLDTSVENLLLEQKDAVAEGSIDEIWISLVQEAISNGVTKEEFSHYLEFLKFSKKNGDHQK